MDAEQLAVVRGWDDTRATLRGWRARPVAVVARWVRGSLAVAVLLLVATWVVALLTVPDPMSSPRPGVAPWRDFGYILYRNGLVLALHAMACVAGFVAGSALPIAAAGYRGWWRRVHDRAGRMAMGFVAAATLFSLATQAYALGMSTADVADALGIAPGLLIARASRCTRCRSPARSSCRWRPGCWPAGAARGTSCSPRRS